MFLACGSRAAQDAAADRLEKELRRLESALKLPQPDGDEAAPLLAKLPLRIAFSTVRVNPSDRAETGFVDLLLSLGGRKESASPQAPLVFPVFGRGRMLDGLAGADLQGDGIEQAARYLCGPCTLREKRLNPAVDLLIAADWDSILEDRPALELPTPVVAPMAAPPELLDVSGPPDGISPLVDGDLAAAPVGGGRGGRLAVAAMGLWLWRSAPPPKMRY